jgi:acetyl esterase/lipase
MNLSRSTHIRTMFVGMILAAVGATVPGSAFAQKREDQPARPSQDAVLAANSVLTANVAYGDDDLQRLDVYAPEGAKQSPTVVFVHGGEWTRGDKAAVSFKPKFFNQNGVVFVSVNYRLSPAVTHPAHVYDEAAAIRWVHDNADRFGGDPKKIVLMGHSAGCHLVTLVSLDSRYLAKVGLRPADLRGVVAWSGGSYDLVEKVEQRGAYADYIKKAFGDSEETWRDASPVQHVSDVKAGPPFLFASVEAGAASHQAAERLAGLIRDAGGRATSKLLEGRDHFGANHLLGAPDDITGAAFLGFVSDVTR